MRRHLRALRLKWGPFYRSERGLDVVAGPLEDHLSAAKFTFIAETVGLDLEAATGPVHRERISNGAKLT